MKGETSSRYVYISFSFYWHVCERLADVLRYRLNLINATYVEQCGDETAVVKKYADNAYVVTTLAFLKINYVYDFVIILCQRSCFAPLDCTKSHFPRFLGRAYFSIRPKTACLQIFRPRSQLWSKACFFFFPPPSPPPITDAKRSRNFRCSRRDRIGADRHVSPRKRYACIYSDSVSLRGIETETSMTATFHGMTRDAATRDDLSDAVISNLKNKMTYRNEYDVSPLWYQIRPAVEVWAPIGASRMTVPFT